MEFSEVVRTQRAIRRMTPDPVPDAAIRQVLDAAVCAPSGGNRQGWSFVVIRDASTKARIAALYREAFAELLKNVPYYRDAAAAPPDSASGRLAASSRHLAEHMAEVPVLIMACIDTAGAPSTITTGASIYPAVQNLMLAARALGLGTTLTTIHRFRDQQIKALLGIPAHVETAALIPLGYPLGKFGRPPRKAVEDVTYYERWGQT